MRLTGKQADRQQQKGCRQSCFTRSNRLRKYKGDRLRSAIAIGLCVTARVPGFCDGARILKEGGYWQYLSESFNSRIERACLWGTIRVRARAHPGIAASARPS